VKETGDKLMEATSKVEELEKKVQAAATEKTKIEQCLKVNVLI